MVEQDLDAIEAEIKRKKEEQANQNLPMAQTDATGGEISNVINTQVQDLLFSLLPRTKTR